jgi:hypothetical protein
MPPSRLTRCPFLSTFHRSLRELFGRGLQVAASMSMSIDYTPPVTPPVTPPIAEPLPPPKSPPVVSPPVAATTAPPVAAPVAATTAPPVAAPTPLPIDETTAPTPAATEPLVEALLTGAPTPDPSEINSNDDPTDPPSGEEDTASLTGNLAAVGTGASSASMNGSMIAMIATLSVAAVAVAAALVVRHKKKTSDRSNDGVSDMSSLVSLSGHEGL